MREQLINTYLDYVNNYLTFAAYADHNGLTETQAARIIELAKDVFNSDHPES